MRVCAALEEGRIGVSLAQLLTPHQPPAHARPNCRHARARCHAHMGHVPLQRVHRPAQLSLPPSLPPALHLRTFAWKRSARAPNGTAPMYYFSINTGRGLIALTYAETKGVTFTKPLVSSQPALRPAPHQLHAMPHAASSARHSVLIPHHAGIWPWLAGWLYTCLNRTKTIQCDAGAGSQGGDGVHRPL